jgi:hypothetical protein
MTNSIFERGFTTKREVKNIVSSQITSSVDDQKNQPNGLAGLDANGKLAISQIPGGVQQLQSQSWDASTNTPNLLTIEKQTGFIWLVGATGNTNLSGITDWQNGDYVIYLGNDTFSKIDNSDNTSLQILNNLSDLNNKTTARGNLEVYSTSQVDTALNLKADKVVGAVANNFASLNSTGNLIDSGKKSTDFEPADVNILKKSNVIDNLTSTNTDLPLSANQGKVLQDGKVDKITGKGLSTNDFNNTYKAQLDNFTENSQDAVGSALTDTATIDLTYDDELNQITADIKDDSINNVKIGTNADIATSKLKQAVITPQLANFSNNDTQDVINNKAQGQITNLENLINTRPIGASNGSVYYLTSQASAIPNYELLSFSPDNSPLDVESITITSATPKIDRLFHSYVSTYEVGNTIINGGNWIFNFYGYTSHINNNVFEIDVYKRDSSGIETLLFTCDTTNLLQTSQISPDLNIANAEVTKQDFSCNATDKIVVKIYAKTDRSVATTITLLHSGTDYASHIHTPIIATHNQLAGAQGGTATEKYHLTLADYNSVLGLSASLNAKADKVDFESAIKFYVAKNGNDLNNGSLIKPFATIQKALSVIPVATNSTDNRLVYTIHIASGTYDEDLSIDIGRKKVILFPEAGAKLGSFNASNWLPTSSINGRNINITCSQTSLDSIRPLFAIISNNNTSSSTHQAYSGGFQISGSLIISQSVSVSGEFLFKGITFFGYDGSVNGANPSINTTGWGGNCNFYLERCRLYGQITGTSLRLQNAFDCRFDALISLATYSQIRNTEINAGMTWLVAPSEVQPIGVYNSRLVGVFTGNTNINLLVDLASNYSFNSNSATLGINTKKILLGTFNNKNIYVSGGVNGTGNDSNDGFTELTALNTLAVANSRLGNTGEKLILLPSQLTESVTFTQQNIEVSGQNASHRGLCGTTGTITANHSGSSQTYSYLNVANFVKSSSQYTILYDVAITGNFSDNGGGVVDAYNLIFNASSVINITGSGIKNFYNQRGGVFNVNNASAQVNVVSFDYISQFNLTAGTLSLRNCIVYIAQGTTFTIGSSGSTFFAENVRFLYPDNSKAKINIPAGVNYSLQNGCIYDIANSTLSGTNIASLYTGYFDNISLNAVNLKSGIASTILATDVNKNIQSLSTTTYPNLTELSYVKGLTSSIQAQLNNKLETSLKGANNGLAELDSTGKVPSSQLPAYVDDVLEFDNFANFPATGEAGKIYVAKDTNIVYRWSGTQYIEISSSLALGETSSTAYRGDRGKIAYDHSQITGNPHSTTKTDVGLGNVDNTADVNKNVLSASKLTTARNINGVSFDGTANITILDNTKIPYQQTFNSTTDWGVASGGFYTITIPASTHNKGTNPTNINVYELQGANYELYIPDIFINASGDVSIKEFSTPQDTRFQGKISINF